MLYWTENPLPTLCAATVCVCVYIRYIHIHTHTVAAHKVGNGFSVQYSIPFADRPFY